MELVRVYKVVEVPTTAGVPYSVELADGGGATKIVKKVVRYN